MAHVLFVCLHNAGRSQMSQALFERAVGAVAVAARDEASLPHSSDSAGTQPAERVHPEVVAAMQELGVDLSDRVPKLLIHELAERADVVVTMGCGDACPYVAGVRYVDWELPNPAEMGIEGVRQVRDEIGHRIDGLLAELEAAPANDQAR